MTSSLINRLMALLLVMTSGTAAYAQSWWSAFNDPVLQELLARAEANNYDLLAAGQRIESARQMSRASRAGYYPTLNANAGYSLEGTSADMQSYKSHAETMGYFSLGLSTSWEIDVFGRISQQLKADKANLQASEAEYEGAMVSLRANVAKAYFQLRMAQEQHRVAIDNIKVSEELLRIANTRYEVGLVPGVDVVQARMAVTQTRSSLPALEADITTAINSLSVLLGEYPESLQSLRDTLPLPEAPQPGPLDNLRQLVLRRPDVVQAQKELDYYAAQEGVAKKEYLPTLSVNAGVGTEAKKFTNLFGNGSLYYQVMPTLSWNAFDGLARNARVAEAKAARMAQEDTYNQTLLTAVQEVYNAKAQWQCDSEQLIYDQMLLKDARRELELQTDRYKQGLCDFSDVANAQSSVLQYENQEVTAQASQLAALVSIYTALGGSWETDNE